jgi:hypothetical protein
MAEEIAGLALCVLALYAGLGLAFAVAFAAEGAAALDPNARGASLGFRILIVPGSAALWPFLLRRWLRGDRTVPIERNAHRAAAAR